MRDVLPALLAALGRGEPVALATVVRTWQSSPSPAGSALVVTASDEVIGAVSGGCVEGAVVELAREVLRTGEPVVESYGVSDDAAFAVGLTCGGSLEVLVERIGPSSGPALAGVVRSVEADEPVAMAVVVRGGSPGARLVVRASGIEGSTGDAALDGLVSGRAREMLRDGRTGALDLGDGEVFVAALVPRPRMIVVGAVDHAAPLCRAGRLLGFRVSVVDARAVFATAARFPDADEVVVEWPHRWLAGAHLDERAVVCVLTHDPKFDVPALVAAVRGPAAYVGAMGSRRTHADRIPRLREAGLTDEEIARIHAPIGLDLAAVTPAETAVSIAAEIVAVLRGGSGRPLVGGEGPLHAGPAT